MNSTNLVLPSLQQLLPAGILCCCDSTDTGRLRQTSLKVFEAGKITVPVLLILTHTMHTETRKL